MDARAALERLNKDDSPDAWLKWAEALAAERQAWGPADVEWRRQGYEQLARAIAAGATGPRLRAALASAGIHIAGDVDDAAMRGDAWLFSTADGDGLLDALARSRSKTRSVTWAVTAGAVAVTLGSLWAWRRRAELDASPR